MEQEKSMLVVVGWGMLLALVLGMVLGWVRYWLGLFLIAQGAVAGLSLPWLLRRIKACQPALAGHPGCGGAFALAALWGLCFLAGQALGLGLAQPWFDPLGFFSRVLAGRSSEFIFGVAATGGVHRAIALGAKGGFWVLFNLIDLGTMCLFFMVMPWNRGGKQDGEDEESQVSESAPSQEMAS